MTIKKMTFSNNLECYYISSQKETEFIFSEIFTEQQYLKHGIIVNEGDCIFDVGANIGLFPIFLNQLFHSLKIYCFEPIKPIFEVLSENIHLHSMENVILFNYGISSENHPEVIFTFYPNMAGNSTAKPLEKLEQRDMMKSLLSQEQVDYYFQNQEIRGELRTLSSVINELEIKTIDLLKIDVEGLEYEVLQGIEEKDWRKIKQIVTEVHNTEGRLEKIKRMLIANGFDIIIEKNNLLSEQVNNLNLYAIRR